MTTEEYIRISNARTCVGKVKCLSESDAMNLWLQKVGKRKVRNGGWRANAKRFNIYICANCGYMHLGHNSGILMQIKRERKQAA